MQIIVVDANALAYRAYYSSLWGKPYAMARSDGTPTGVIYSFLNQMKVIAEQAQCAKFVFAWDSLSSKRRKLYPTYKINRKEKREADLDIDSAFWQFDQLYGSILPRVGFTNNFKYDGYEADDIVARCCEYTQAGWKITIVSTDQDLYQLLSPNVRILKPKEWTFYTYNHFKVEYCGLEPEDFVSIKAIAGCSGDNVKGIRGVGEKTALRYLVDTSGKDYPKINNPEAHEIIKRNWPLVRLPFKGCPMPDIVFDKPPDFREWQKFVEEYEFGGLKKNESFWRKILKWEDPKGYFPPPKKWAKPGQ